MAVSNDGTVSVDGTLVEQLRLAEFSPNTNLEALGNSLYAAPSGSSLVPASMAAAKFCRVACSATALLELLSITTSFAVLTSAVGRVSVAEAVTNV